MSNTVSNAPTIGPVQTSSQSNTPRRQGETPDAHVINVTITDKANGDLNYAISFKDSAGRYIDVDDEGIDTVDFSTRFADFDDEARGGSMPSNTLSINTEYALETFYPLMEEEYDLPNLDNVAQVNIVNESTRVGALKGTDGDDHITNLAGFEGMFIDGRGGNDEVYGNDEDKVFGGRLKDTLILGDSATGDPGEGNDLVLATDDATVVANPGKNTYVLKGRATGNGGNDADLIMAHDNALANGKGGIDKLFLYGQSTGDGGGAEPDLIFKSSTAHVISSPLFPTDIIRNMAGNNLGGADVSPEQQAAIETLMSLQLSLVRVESKLSFH